MARGSTTRRILYERFEPGVTADWDILRTTRTSPATQFGTPTPLGAAVNTGLLEAQPYFAGNTLYFVRYTGAGPTMMAAPRAGGDFGPADPLANTPPASFPVVTRDELTLFLYVADDVWISQRAATNAQFPAPTKLDAVSSDQYEEPTDVSADGCTLYLARGQFSGFRRIYSATRSK